mmetsp:Transcript_18991/g.33460  ORF Transcript_18991/g.33460 Transcript_18991/m.33460 type:complete len:208 (+) Transcript_18991:455-1078(+)
MPLHPMRATCKLQRKTFQNEMHRCPGTRRSKFQKEIEATKGPKGFQRGVHRVMFPSVKSRDRFDHETHVSKLSQYLRHIPASCEPGQDLQPVHHCTKGLELPALMLPRKVGYSYVPPWPFCAAWLLQVGRSGSIRSPCLSRSQWASTPTRKACKPQCRGQLSPQMASPACIGQPLQQQPVAEQRAASVAPGVGAEIASASADSAAAE